MGAYGGLGERCKTQLRLNAPIIFFGPEAGTISTFDHRTSICSPSIRSPAWNRTDFCTSDHHFGMTHGRKNVSPSRNPCESDPRKLGLYQHSITAHRSVRLQFVHLHGTAPISVRVITTSVSLTAERLFRLQGTHVIPILFWSQFTIDVRLRTHTDHFFSGRSSNGSASMETNLLFAFLSTAERRLTRAFLERHHARATSDLFGRRSSLPFFLTFVGFHMVYTRLQ